MRKPSQLLIIILTWHILFWLLWFSWYMYIQRINQKSIRWWACLFLPAACGMVIHRVKFLLLLGHFTPQTSNILKCQNFEVSKLKKISKKISKKKFQKKLSKKNLKKKIKKKNFKTKKIQKKKFQKIKKKQILKKNSKKVC